MKFNPAEDGITHINIYSKGKTELGRLLSNFAYTPFELTIYGKFASVEAYWYWLLLYDGGAHPQGETKKLRTLHGFAAKKFGKSLISKYLKDTQFTDHSEVFKRKIKVALKAKLDCNPDIKKQLIESTLPLTHYYVFNGKVKEAGYEWQVEWWEQTRRQLQESLWT